MVLHNCRVRAARLGFARRNLTYQSEGFEEAGVFVQIQTLFKARNPHDFANETHGFSSLQIVQIIDRACVYPHLFFCYSSWMVLTVEPAQIVGVVSQGVSCGTGRIILVAGNETVIVCHGAPSYLTVTPALPKGLVFSEGAIRGTPLVGSPLTEYSLDLRGGSLGSFVLGGS